MRRPKKETAPAREGRGQIMEQVMRKIVNGIRYDTEKARLVGQAGCCCWDAWLFCARRSGRYFLVGEGGPMSRFAQSAGRNVFKGGRDIIPLSREEALRWAREYLEPNEIGAEFGNNETT